MTSIVTDRTGLFVFLFISFSLFVISSSTTSTNTAKNNENLHPNKRYPSLLRLLERKNVKKPPPPPPAKNRTSEAKRYNHVNIPVISWFVSVFRNNFKTQVMKPRSWYTAHDGVQDAIYKALDEKSLGYSLHKILYDAWYDLDDCMTCTPDATSILPLKKANDTDVVLIYKSIIQLIALRPLDCTSRYDYCSYPKSSWTSKIYPPCTKSYCWFFPGNYCTPRYTYNSYRSSSKIATCNSVSWYKSYGIKCPVTNCEPDTSKRSENDEDDNDEKENDRRQGGCSSLMHCGTCENEDTEEGSDCQGADHDGNRMCCMCMLSRPALDDDDDDTTTTTTTW